MVCCLFTRLPANESPALSFPGQWEAGRDTTKPADRVVAASAASQSVPHSRAAQTVAQCSHGPGQQRGSSRAGQGRPSAGPPTSHAGRPSRPRWLTSLLRPSLPAISCSRMLVSCPASRATPPATPPPSHASRLAAARRERVESSVVGWSGAETLVQTRD